jgi:regulator of RNase E activity RraA
VVGKPKTAELRPGPGFRIRTKIDRPPADVVEAFKAYDTPLVSDLMNRLYTMSPAIRCMTDPPLGVVGPACTIKAYPGDNLMVHKALDVAQPGDVLVIDTHSSELTAVMGDILCTKARHRGIAGVVIDGLVRDLPAIRALGNFPVFARGVTPIGPLHRGPGEINHAISAGGIVVHPGDIIIGDLNGVLVVPQELTGPLLEGLATRSAVETEYIKAVTRGEFSNDWVDDTLAEGGVIFEA